MGREGGGTGDSVKGDLGREMGKERNKTIFHRYLKRMRKQLGNMDANGNQLHERSFLLDVCVTGATAGPVKDEGPVMRAAGKLNQKNGWCHVPNQGCPL